MKKQGHSPRSRRFVLLVVGALLLGFIGSMVWTVAQVTRQRDVVSTRVSWMQEIRVAQGALRTDRTAAALTPVLGSLDALSTRIARGGPSPETTDVLGQLTLTTTHLSTALEAPATTSVAALDAGAEDVGVQLDALVGALRGDTATASARLATHFTILTGLALAGVAVAVIAFLLLLVAIRRRRVAESAEHRLRLAETALVAARDRAESASLAKTRFLANASDQLAAPVRAVQGYIDVLERTEPTPAQLEYLGLMRQATQGLTQSIDSVMTLSASEGAGLALAIGPAELRPLIESVARRYEAEARRKGLPLTYVIDPAVPRHIRSDPFRLTQVVESLVTNAIQNSDEGWVSIQASLVADDPMQVCIAVLDTGCGVPETQVESLFTPFAQGTDASERGAGVGLGLAVARRLVNRLGGTLRYAPRPECGSVFSVVVPIAGIDTSPT